MTRRNFVQRWALLAGVFVGLFCLWGCGGGSGGSGGGGAVTPPVSETIGSGGGQIVDGNATLVVPANSTSTTVTAPALFSVQPATASQYPADARLVPGTAFNFTTSGAALAVSVRISIRYNGATLPNGAVESGLALFQVVSGAWTQVSDSTIDTNNKIARGTSSTLGVFAVLATVGVSGSTASASSGSTGGTNRSTTLLFLSDNGVAGANSLYSSVLGSSLFQPISTQGPTSNESIGHAALSADAKTVVYDTQSTAGYLLITASTDGSNVQQTLAGASQPNNAPAIPRVPSFSPDGGKIVFIYNLTGSDQIYVINPDGSGMTQLTKNFSGKNVDNPAYTKAGSIRFISQTASGSTQYNLMNADGSSLTSTTTFGPAVAPWYTYSPDGSKFVYAAQANNKYDVFTGKADGSGQTQLTKLGASSIGNARFSASGTQIIFDAVPAGSTTRNLYTINADGTSQQQLTTSLTGNLTLEDAH